MSELGNVIRRIRQQERLNTTEFGALLGVNHSQVSRYELGRASPGYVVTGRLLKLASGAERNVILDRLAVLLGSDRVPLTEERATSELQRIGGNIDPLWERLRRTRESDRSPGTPWDWEFLGLTPNLTDLVQAVVDLYGRGLEVDYSVVEILQLWLAHDTSDPAIRECFSDAAKYLEMALTVKVKRQPDVPGLEKKTGS